MHGKDIRCYLASRDVSGDLTSIDFTANCATHDATTFNNADWTSVDAGLFGWEAPIEGFYDSASTGIEAQLVSLLGTTTGIVSVYDGDADAANEAGVLGGDAIVTQHGRPITVNDLTKLSGSLLGAGKLGLRGRLLAPLASITAGTTGTTVDASTHSLVGGRANLHVTSVAGSATFTIAVRHSTDDSTYADVMTFPAVTAAGAATTVVASGVTINRYTKCVVTVAGTGTMQYVCGLARY